MDEKSVIHPTEYINHSKIFYLPINFGIPVHQIQYLCTVLRFIDFSSLLLCKTRRHNILTSGFRFDATVKNQLRTSEYINKSFILAYILRKTQTQIKS